MDDGAIRELLHRVAALERQQVRLRMGEVTGDGVDVALGGASASYSDVKQLVGTGVAAGQQVACLARGNDLLVLGGVHGQMGLPIVTSLPASPRHGMQIIYATAVAGVNWHLVYNALSASAYKWEYVGGPALTARVDATEPTVATFTTFQALATAGPSITLPLAGDYRVEIGCSCFAASAAQDAIMSYDIGGVGALDVNGLAVGALTTNTITGYRDRPVLGAAAATALVAKYRSGAASATNFGRRSMAVTPVRVG